ncbi:MAG: hypothetical protein ACJA2S_004025, partial [Cyclobacteriaceae bacterium]
TDRLLAQRISQVIFYLSEIFCFHSVKILYS